jgi:hypothetical protein
MMALSTGIQTGYYAARRVFEDPAGNYQSQNWTDMQAAYSLLWAYYNNALFDRTASLGNSSVWSAYKSAYTLYRNIRLIYNPTRRLVDFYAGQVYPGVLSVDGSTLPDGVPMAIPFEHDTPSTLTAAIAQFWQWSNWQAKKAVMVRYGAALGSVLIEVTDDPERGKVSAEIVWPGFVSDLELDPAGNVKGYALEYLSLDAEENRSFLYRKEVDGDYYRYYRDGQPYNYGSGTTVPNSYGFVPAVWVKHSDTGSDVGSPAIAGSLGKIDELNNLASHVHDQIHKVIGAPLVLWSSGSLQNLFGATKRGATSEFPEPTADTESVLMLKGPPDGKVDSLAGALSLADSMTYMQQLMTEIERDHPELTVFEELRTMSQVTGPAASRLVAPAISRLAEAAANYDRQSVKLFQMAVAIGGMRASSGAWGNLSRQQQKFSSFSLDSYTRGDLDLAILPRPVLIPTKLETAQEKQAIWTGVGLAVKAGVPLSIILEDEGWSEEDIARLKAAKAAEPTPLVPATQTPNNLSNPPIPTMRALVTPGGQ